MSVKENRAILLERVKKEIFLKTRGKIPAKPLENFTISVTRYSTKQLDYDNYMASLKAYIDGLKLSGVIIDDSWEYIKKIEVDQIVSKDRKMIISVKAA
jgi:Holliday junction resolvase RusA-like endonuclease